MIKCVLIASRGFLKEQFLEHLIQYADAQGKKVIVFIMLYSRENKIFQITTEQRGKFMLTHSSSGFKHALKEVLEDPNVAARLADTKVSFPLVLFHFTY